MIMLNIYILYYIILEQSITERHWCYNAEQLEKSAWEKKKSGDGLLQRL